MRKIVGNTAGLQRPPRLRSGMAAALVAPAFHFDREKLAVGRAFLETNFGIRTVHLDSLFEKRGYFAGSDERRMGELLHWLRNPDVDALLAVRGGYGTARVYPGLIAALKKTRNLKPKIVAGASDLTVLLNGLHQDLGWVTFHSPVVIGRPMREPEAIETRTFSASLIEGVPLGRITHPRMVTIHPGKAKGPLVGGCLSLLVSSLGTSYEFNADGRILFLEDVDERPYRLDRMITQLAQAGKLDKARALVFGQMHACEPKRPKDGGAREPQAIDPGLSLGGRVCASKTAVAADAGVTWGSWEPTALEAIRMALEPVLAKRGMPVVYDFPAGHGNPQITFPIGCAVEVHADPKEPAVVFTEPGVS